MRLADRVKGSIPKLHNGVFATPMCRLMQARYLGKMLEKSKPYERARYLA
jgi:hypothetical protein